MYILCLRILKGGFPGGSVVRKAACQCRAHWFHLWCGKIPHAGEQATLRASAAEGLRATAAESLRATAAEPELWSPGATAAEARKTWRPCSATGGDPQ